MKLDIKEYERIKIKKYLKKNQLFFLLNGVTTDSSSWKNIEQSLNSVGFLFFKNLNNITNKELKNSTFKNIKEMLNGPTFLMSPRIEADLSKDVLFSKLSSLKFTMLAIKMNNKIYPCNLLKKKTNTTNYINNVLLFNQFNIANLKYNTKLISKNKCSK